MGYLQLRRKGRNAYVADDVDALLAALKREIADARMEAYEARRMLMIHGPGSMAPAEVEQPVVDLRDHAAATEELDALDATIAERQRALAELDEAIATRRRYLRDLGQQLVAWADRPITPTAGVGDGEVTVDGEQRWNRTAAYDQQVQDFLDDTDVDTASRSFLGYR
jgi:hypothetical protein